MKHKINGMKCEHNTFYQSFVGEEEKKKINVYFFQLKGCQNDQSYKTHNTNAHPKYITCLDTSTNIGVTV